MHKSGRLILRNHELFSLAGIGATQFYPYMTKKILFLLQEIFYFRLPEDRYPKIPLWAGLANTPIWKCQI
jgi:hypothetical protein